MILATDRLGCRFGARPALQDISLTLAAGELLAVVGPDGAGKTTLLRLLAGALQPTSGTISTTVARGRTGYLSQHFSLYPDLTVAENLAFFGRIYGLGEREIQSRGRQLLEWVGLWEFRNRLAIRLSGGMKQKLSLACALVHQTDLLLLDEPTTAVDPISRREFWSLIQDLARQGAAILLTTPYMEEADRCDRVAFLHEGRVLICADPRELRRQFPYRLAELRSARLDRRALTAAALSLPGAVSAHPFGEVVHVSLNQSVPESTSDLFIRAIEPSLEDLYIHLLTRETENRGAGQ